MTRSQRLRYLRQTLLHMKRPEFCHKTDLNIPTYTGWETDRHGGLSKCGAQKVADGVAQLGLFVTADWLLTGQGETPCLIDPNADLDAADKKMITDMLGILSKRYDVMSCFIQDNALAPFLKAGDFVAGHKTKDQAAIENRCCIVFDSQQQYHCGVVHAHAGQLTLTPLIANEINAPRYFNLDEIEAVAPIVWTSRAWRSQLPHDLNDLG